jgi:hypothetical protein
MTIEEPINSEPDVICASEADPNFVPNPAPPAELPPVIPQEVPAPPEEDNEEDSDDEEENTCFEEVPDTEIFYVTEDGVPVFYASDMETAVKQLEEYLVYKVDCEDDRNFFVDHISETEYHICSRNDYYVVNFDCVEYVYKIDSISKVRTQLP